MAFAKHLQSRIQMQLSNIYMHGGCQYTLGDIDLLHTCISSKGVNALLLFLYVLCILQTQQKKYTSILNIE